MATTTVEGRPIVAGFDWSATINVTATPVAFPSGCVLVSHVRRKVTDGGTLAVLGTADATIVRVNDGRVTLTIPGSASRTWTEGTVSLDLARTDTAQPQYLGFRLDIPVRQPVTRLGVSA